MISILTPSRSRPVLAKRMIDSALVNAGCNIEFKFFLNDDDPDLEEYKRFLNESQYLIGPNQSTSYSWNLLSNVAKYDILFLVGDDAQFSGDNWGLKVIDAFELFPDKILCAYPKVPTLGKNKNPHFCLHKNWVRALGYFVPPVFYHWYVDTWIREVSKELCRFYLIDGFEMPIENIKDSVSRGYHNSWMRQKDDYLWGITRRYREKDIETLTKFIKEFR